MRAIWQGLLSFGLINIPIKMFKATEDEDFHFSLLHSICHNPLKYQRYCPVCDQVVSPEETVRGYQYEAGRFILLSEEELDVVASPRTKTIEIISFVQAGEVPAVYYDEAYYLQPSTGGEKAFSLLGTALARQKKEALCRMSLRSRPKLCLVAIGDNNLRLSTIHYGSEVRSPQSLGQFPHIEGSQAELELTELLINKLTRPFHPEELPNTYKLALSEIIEKKLSGQEVHIAKRTPEPQVANILEALQASLERVEKDGVPTYAR